MSVDYPRAWEIARATDFEQHHPKCSYRTHRGGFLCDCTVLTRHPEYQDDVFHGAGGLPRFCEVCGMSRSQECDDLGH